MNKIINNSQSMVDVSWGTRTDLCFASATFREATVQTALNRTFYQSTLCKLYVKVGAISYINIKDIRFYQRFTKTLI